MGLVALAGVFVRGIAGAAPERGQGPPIDLSRASTCDFIGQQESLPAAVPQRLLHQARQEDEHRPPGQLPGRVDAAEHARQPIAAEPYNFNDGFSPGQVIIVRRSRARQPAGVRATNPVGLANLGAYKRKQAPVVVIDAKTGKRWPIWVELDSNATTPEETTLLIHPARNYAAKHRYIVALRNLKTETGAMIPAPDGFRYYRDELESGEPVINRRRNHFERIFETLAEAGIKRRSLYLAWDFTVASDRNIAERSCSCATTRSASSATASSTTARSRAPRRGSRSTR